MSPDEFARIGNKSVSIYCVPGLKGVPARLVIKNYIYRRWFKPYRSELEWDRFLCKFIEPIGLDPEERVPSISTFESLLSLNKSICETFTALQQHYKQLLASDADSLCEVIRDHEFYVLQPLFQAIIIVVSEALYCQENSSSVGRLPVYLVKTGFEGQLSAPITFDVISDKIMSHLDVGTGAVQVTLETAVGFIMGLEAREVAAFGMQPDPLASWRTWPELLHQCGIPPGEEYLHGPASKFVDVNKHPGWSELAEKADRFCSRREGTAFLMMQYHRGIMN